MSTSNLCNQDENINIKIKAKTEFVSYSNTTSEEIFKVSVSCFTLNLQRVYVTINSGFI